MARDQKPPFLRSLRTRFIAFVGLTIAICLVASTLVTLKLHYQQLIKAKREKAQVLIDNTIRLFTHAPSTVGHGVIQSFFQAIGSHSDVRSARLIDKNGVILKSSKPDEIGIRFLYDNPPSTLTGDNTYYRIVDEGIIEHRARTEQREMRPGLVTIMQKPRDERWAFLPQIRPGRAYRHSRTLSATSPLNNLAGCGRCHREPVSGSLNIGLFLDDMNQSLQIVGTRLIMWAIVTMMLTGAVIGILFSKLVNSPLGGLIRTMRAVERGDLQTRAVLKHRDEIGLLGEKFNTMVEQLEVAQEEIHRYHKEQMERASVMASVGEMASALAHEIRNPLAGISGAVQVLRRNVEPDDPRHSVLSEIVEQIDRLAKAVSNILSYTRPHPLKLEMVMLNEVLSEAMAAFETQLRESNITVVREIQPGLSTVLVDPRQMQQVFMNLILNARKAMPNGGELRLGIYAGRKGERDVQIVEVGDTSPGLSPDRLEAIFKPFYTKKGGDTGLGLSAAQEIVSRHGGEITAHSEPDKGTVFVVTLPVDGPSKAGDSSATSRPHSAETGSC